MEKKTYHLNVGGANIEIRPLQNTDSLEEMTGLLNRAYKQLADLGLRYTATYQDAEITAKRVKDAFCLVGIRDERMLATIAYYSPEKTNGAFWYDQTGVAKFGQFAVEPALQKSGIGNYLIQLIEQKAWADGAQELALDTAEEAVHLISYYQKRGYRLAGEVDWNSTNYRSVILSKKLCDYF